MRMTCNEAVNKLVDYLHDELDSSDNEKVTEHIENCNKCCGKFEFEEKFTRMIQDSLCGASPPEQLRSKILDKLRTCM